MRIFLCLALWLSALQLGAAQRPTIKCVVCGELIRGKFFWLDGPSLAGKQAVCFACNHLETTCSVCAMPVKFNFKKLDDGRLLCRDDAAIAVLSQETANDTFGAARHDLLHLLAGFGQLPDGNVNLHLVSPTEINQMHGGNPPGHSKTILMGLTKSSASKGKIEHSIYIVDGLPPARFLATCAHEWAHCWIHENVSSERKLDGNSVEGFCEWVAYKLMTERNEAIEKKIILANAYTRGQVDAFIKADEELRKYDIVKWMKEGVDKRIDTNNTARVRALESRPAETPALPWQATAPTPVPDTLVLKGISGSAKRKFALINDCTLQQSETGKVRVGSTNVVLQCVQIGRDSVVVRIRGEEKTTELFLSDSR